MTRMAMVALLLAACGGGNDRITAPPAPAPTPTTEPAPGPAPAGARIELSVTEDGFVPTPIEVKAGQQITLVITRKTEATCAKEIIIRDHGIEAELPLDKPVAIAFTPKKTGELVYGCAMDQMIRGVLIVRE